MGWYFLTFSPLKFLCLITENPGYLIILASYSEKGVTDHAFHRRMWGFNKNEQKMYLGQYQAIHTWTDPTVLESRRWQWCWSLLRDGRETENKNPHVISHCPRGPNSKAKHQRFFSVCSQSSFLVIFSISLSSPPHLRPAKQNYLPFANMPLIFMPLIKQNCVFSVWVWDINAIAKLRHQLGNWVYEPGTHNRNLDLKQDVWECSI